MLTLSISGFLAFLSSTIFVVGYISNNSLFPEPLNAEEEKMYLEKIYGENAKKIETALIKDASSVGAVISIFPLN